MLRSEKVLALLLFLPVESVDLHFVRCELHAKGPFTLSLFLRLLNLLVFEFLGHFRLFEFLGGLVLLNGSTPCELFPQFANAQLDHHAKVHSSDADNDNDGDYFDFHIEKFITRKRRELDEIEHAVG